MRIDRIEVGAFGRLEGFDTGPDPLEGLVVVLGPNEAGKSTLFTFLTTALYGFQPATRERNPHVPWGTDEATGKICVRLDSDGCAEIERTLRSQPVGRLTVAGRATDLRNQAVPWVGHVPRTVFRQVFAITLGELAGLDEDTWARIQDRMIGSMGAADLQSPRAVAEVLEREAGEIWRPNRRGNQRLRDLQARLRELRAKRSEALERDTRIRRMVEEGEGIRAELQTLREQRQLDRAEIERTQSLLPVKRQLGRVTALRAEGGPTDELRDLPRDPADRLARLQEDVAGLHARLKRIDHEIEDREAVIAEASATADLIEHRDRIVRLSARAAALEHDRQKRIELESESGEVEARLDAAGQAVLTGSWRGVSAQALISLSIDLLRERVTRARGAEPARAGPGAAPDAVHWGALAGGAALLVWGLVTGRPVIAALGAALVAASAMLLIAARRRAHGSASPPSASGVTDLLGDLPIRPELLRHPGPELVAGLERLRELTLRREELLRTGDAIRERMEEISEAAGELAGSLGREVGADVAGVARDLDAELRNAERLRDMASAAERELSRLRHERADVSGLDSKAQAELDRLSSRLEAFAPGDVKRAASLARTRLDAHDRADQIEDELSRAHPDLAALQAAIERLDLSGTEWASESGSPALARARIEAHDERIEVLLARSEALEAEIGHLREQDTVDAVDSETASLREAEAELMRERDRKWVLAKLLREADRRFREEHQPDLLRRAGSYLRHLTDGRYERLVVDETHSDHLFHLVAPHLPAPVPLAPPVSTGTLEQAYLSLRLAIVDHLDQGGERLPLFVDEILVNWDGERRARGVDVLAGVAGTRQVFVFTCHDGVASELQERGARVLELGGR